MEESKKALGGTRATGCVAPYAGADGDDPFVHVIHPEA